MAFVKLDTNMLNSTLWYVKMCRDIFITSLLMAEPRELTKPTPAISVRLGKPTGFVVPPGWYGFVPASGIGIVRRSLVEPERSGMLALEKLGEKEAESRTTDHGGRRMVRVEGGFIILNYFKYRDKDHTSAGRQKLWRERQKAGVTALRNVSSRNITEAEADAEIIYKHYPEQRRVGKPKAIKAIRAAISKFGARVVLEKTQEYARAKSGSDPQFIPLPATFYNQERFNDDPCTWIISKQKPPALTLEQRNRMIDGLQQKKNAMFKAGKKGTPEYDNVSRRLADLKPEV